MSNNKFDREQFLKSASSFRTKIQHAELIASQLRRAMTLMGEAAVSLVVISRDIGCRKYRRHLVLRGSHLIVLSFGKNPHFPQLGIQILHERRNTVLDRAKILVFKLFA